MKTTILKSFFCLAVMLFVSNSVMAQKSNQKAVIKTTLHCDHCKLFETCGLKFNTEIHKIKGVKMYELENKTQTFTIYYNPKKTTLLEIKKGIAKLSYDANEVKATEEGLASLDRCCKVY